MNSSDFPAMAASGLTDRRVAIARMAGGARYPDRGGDLAPLAEALDRLGGWLGWAQPGRGPLAGVIAPGANVLLKPNLVLHRNQLAGGGWEELLTHATLIAAVTEAALQAGAARVIVGDAPLQSCDFDELLSVTGLGEWARALSAREPRFGGIRDFRRTTCVMRGGVRVAEENKRSEEDYVLFDLAGESLLEEVVDEEHPFRVCWYDPRLMRRTHYAGRHQYLVARDVITNDVVINLPKLKTHKKAGITCALKNLIGINGNKEYLPHHRMGGSLTGGDCYPGQSKVKEWLEEIHDQQNMTESTVRQAALHSLTLGLSRLLWVQQDRFGIEGSWSGNDTIWRTCLDLNRILLYGAADGSVGQQPARRVVHIVDAILAGEGDGPLSPEPLPLGLLLAGGNAAAIDWAGSHLLGYDPQRLPISREAFGSFRWPISQFSSADVEVLGDLGTGIADQILPEAEFVRPTRYPPGWRDAVLAAVGVR